MAETPDHTKALRPTEEVAYLDLDRPQRLGFLPTVASTSPRHSCASEAASLAAARTSRSQLSSRICGWHSPLAERGVLAIVSANGDLPPLLATITVLALATGAVTRDPPDAAVLIEQPLTGLEDVCEEADDSHVRSVRFATLDAAGHDEDHLELRTTTTGATRTLEYLEYLVNGAVVFTQTNGKDPQVTPAGLELLRSEDRSAKVLAAFAGAHPRVYAIDVEAPLDSCGALAGKSEQLLKCGAIAVLGCYTRNPVVCLASGSLALLCTYLVNKVCEENAESCEDHPPGWTEG